MAVTGNSLFSVAIMEGHQRTQRELRVVTVFLLYRIGQNVIKDSVV